jgi:hypothetical protein
MQARDPGYAYPTAPYANGPSNGGPPQRADFSVDFKRDKRQTYEPAYGYPAADPQWHYPALPAGDMSMAAPYPAQPSIDYRSTTKSPAYGGSHAETAYAPPPLVDVARGDPPKQRMKQDTLRLQAPGSAITDKPIAPNRTKAAPTMSPGTATGPDLFRPALEIQ